MLNASIVWVWAAIVGLLSIAPTLNMLSSHQLMNSSFDPLHLVNTYGAFGSITRTRNEIVIEGTDDAKPTGATMWREYQFKGKPGDPSHRPPQVAPYHLRLDWLMWFAAMSTPNQHDWFSGAPRQAAAGRRANARTAPDESVSGSAADVCPRAVLRVPLHDAGGTAPDRRLVAQDARRQLLSGSVFEVTRSGSSGHQADAEPRPRCCISSFANSGPFPSSSCLK